MRAQQLQLRTHLTQLHAYDSLMPNGSLVAPPSACVESSFCFTHFPIDGHAIGNSTLVGRTMQHMYITAKAKVSEKQQEDGHWEQ